jgi:hypothetical protein
MTRSALIALVALALTAGPAAAHGKHKHKAKAKGKDKGVAVVFVDRDRDVVRTYFVDTYGRASCPPGLAKKGNGCLPPGQAKKRYVIGQPLPSAIVVQPVPVVLETRLGPAPDGYRYALVDGDLVKLALGTMLVVDAIDAWVD